MLNPIQIKTQSGGGAGSIPDRLWTEPLLGIIGSNPVLTTKEGPSSILGNSIIGNASVCVQELAVKSAPTFLLGLHYQLTYI